MAQSLRNVGVAILVLGVVLFVVPYLGLPAPGGPPYLGLYIAGGGAVLWVLGRLLS